MYDVPADVTDVATVGGAGVTGTPGQNGVVTFDAVAGQNVQLTADQSTYGVCELVIAVTGPSGQSIWSTTCFGASTTFGPTALPETGTYTIGLDPRDEATGSVHLTLTEVP